jgi:putative cell wall-binding protein
MIRNSAIRRSWAVLAVLGVIAAFALASATTGGAATGFAFTRYAGSDRYDTAKRIATDTFGTSDFVIIASGTSFPDALAASYAAGLGGVPILLTPRDSLADATSAGITALGAKSALIIGGTAAVSANVENALRSKGLTTKRVAGANRYETSKAVAESGGASPVGKIDNNPTAVVASGETFADALSGGPVAYAGRLPVVLTTGSALSPEAKAALTDLAIKNVLLIGGTSSVSSATQKSIADMGITVTRLAGFDRTETATKVADYAIATLAFDKTKVDLARGDDYPDALAASTHGGKSKTPLLLASNPSSIGAQTRGWLSGNSGTLTSGKIMGGTSAVSSAAESDATTAATSGSPTTTTAGPTTTAAGATTTTTLIGLPTTTSTTAGPTTTTTTPANQLQQCPPGQTGPGEPFCSAATPAFASASASSTTNVITVTYNKAIACNTVDADGSDYTLSNGSGITIANCDGTTSLVVRITPATKLKSGDTGTVNAHLGNDGNTVMDSTGVSQSPTDHVDFPAAS